MRLTGQQSSGQFLKVYQIYYQPDQIIEPDYIPYPNPDCTVYFENSVISKLVSMGAHVGAEYFGVVGPTLRWKVESCGRGPRINSKSFKPNEFELKLSTERPDVMAYLQYNPHNPIRYHQTIHPNLETHFIRVLRRIGYNIVPTILQDVIYCNAFVAKSEIYDRYVDSMLAPAMRVMEGMPEIMENSGYPKTLPAHLAAKFGVPHYPYHSFVAERLFSYFCHIHNLKVGYY